MHAGRALPQAFLAAALLAAPLHPAAQAAPVKQSHLLKQADAAFRDGLAARQKGNLELARARFAEVVKLEPQIAEGHEALGAVLLEMGRLADAIPELEAAAKLKPHDAGNEANLALAYARAGQTAKAIPHFDAAMHLAQEPGQPPVGAAFYDAYGRALAAVGKPDLALNQFMAAEALVGRRAQLDDAIGSLYAQQEKWDEARARFEHAIALDGGYMPARIHLGILLRQQHDLADALATLEAAAKLTPPSPEAMLEYGRTLAAAGQDD